MIYNKVVSKDIYPLVSIIITNYNYENFVGDAIQSALSQTYSNIEIIIIDDGSKDNSVEIISKYLTYQNVRFIKQKNKGVVVSRNRGIDESRGEYVLYLDGDDRIPDKYTETLVKEALSSHLDVTYCNFRRFGDENELRIFPEFDIELMKSENIVHMSSLIKRDCMVNHRFDENLNRTTHEDWDFFLGLALDGAKFGKAKGTELLYRAHGQSRSYNIETPDELNKQGFSLYKTYMYIIEKYRERYPGQIDLTEKSEIIGWWRIANERFMMIQDYKNIVSDKDDQIMSQREHIGLLEKTIQDKDNLLLNTVNSKKYRIAVKVASPLVFLRHIFKRKKNS